ncbi:MAG TPA: formyltetrahydrofolate deformylase [Thermoanaerobaculia bacterium]|nr:formyltetrahydrofolate deformylase [Thermoanaerobaculia bacterium]
MTDEPNSEQPRSVVLLLQCPLRRGLAARLTEFVYEHGGRILYHDQFVDPEDQQYFTRLKWDVSTFTLKDPEIARRIGGLVEGAPDTEWSLHDSSEIPRMAVFASKDPACLDDILARWRSGEWRVDIPVVVANHPDLEPVARRFGVDFRTVSVTKENRDAAEEEHLGLLEAYRIEFVVLARYMQIVSGRLIRAYPNRIINIHHAFLPAFPGARPYHAARARGVKIIGATSHYVTESLDAGPIIEQEVLHVTHRHSVEDLIRLGRDLEKVVLSRAIYAHLRRKVIVHKGRTVVFD